MIQNFFKNSRRCFRLHPQISSNNDDLAELKKLQRRFQRRDNLPVFLKGGPADKVLFAATIGLTVLGFIHTMRLLYTMSYPTSSSKMEE